MPIPFRLSSRGAELSPDQEALVQKAVAGLERFFDGVSSCRIAVSIPNHRPTGGPVTWTVRVGMSVPGAVLAVNRRGRPNFRQALDDTFDAARRRLQDYSQGLRGDVKRHPDGAYDRPVVGAQVRP